MYLEDKKDLQTRLNNFSLDNDEFYKITRIEAQYLAKLVNADWRK